jgi:hypothetical protein
MGATNFENIECLCAFIAQLGPFKSAFVGLLDAAIGMLRTAQTAIALVPQDFSDQIRLLGYQAELQAVQMTLEAVSGPLSMVTAQVRPYADCPPVANAAQVILNFKNQLIGGILDWQYEIEQLIEALNTQGQKVEEIERWIQALEDVKDAVEFCGI